ncbi:hypothetical protein [Vallitalea sp.]|jgi:hypothetical protein|uniref:hypothetical protein n=1 Tax=Vallitalea sp. TaxID=1882829 RepID=UPI0025DED13C|nr:hypothetical protein [Vallitalea sp.]MCT4686370.1 hypothetical protein [Vallitalea sp.]
MLSKIVFNDGINKLLTEYGDRGFKMSKEKSTQWYSYFRNYSDSDFKASIDKCLKECNHPPYMADIIKIKDSSNKVGEKAIEYARKHLEGRE